MKCSKNERLSVGVSVIQQAKIQAQVLVPLVKALEVELGVDQANALDPRTDIVFARGTRVGCTGYV